MADFYFRRIFFFSDLVSGLGWTFSFASRFSHLTWHWKTWLQVSVPKVVVPIHSISLFHVKGKCPWSGPGQVKFKNDPLCHSLMLSLQAFASDLWSHFVNQTATDCTSTKMLEKGFFNWSRSIFCGQKQELGSSCSFWCETKTNKGIVLKNITR